MRLGTYYRNQVLKRIRLLPRAGASVLDLGCHDGTILSGVAGRLRVGLDLHPVPRASVLYVRGDARHIPLLRDTFDWVFALEILEHVDGRGDLLRSAMQVLRPGGTLVLSVPHRGLRVFPASLTPWVHRIWGHGKGFKGIGEDEVRSLLPADLVASVRFFTWRGQAFLREFLPLRAAWTFLPPLGRRWARQAVDRDVRNQRSSNEGYLLFGIIQRVAR